MKHSKKESKPKGCSKGKNDDNVLRTGPIMIEEIMQDEPSYSKRDLAIREMNIRTDPTNDQSPIIKRRFKPLDNPRSVLELLKGMQFIKEGCVGNNVTTGPNQHAFWRGCLTGAIQNKFVQFAREVGAETNANLLQVEQRLVAHFAPREVLREQKKHMRPAMRVNARNTTARACVGAVDALMDVLATKAPKEHKNLMIEQGFNPETSTVEQFVEISERAETKKTIYEERKRYFNSKDMSSSDEDSPSKKRKPSKPKNFHSQDRKEFCCKEHGPNSTHNSSDCKVIHGRSSDKQAWKSKDKSENKCSDYKAKYKNKSRELHILQSQAKEAKTEAKEAKVKWTKAYENLEARNNASSSESEGELKSVKETVREDEKEVFLQESSSNSSSSSSDSE
jgi:hypothetical protein